MFLKNDKNKINDLMKAILRLQTANEARRFFRDLLTKKELIEFANRWKAARMLSKKITYKEIEKETGLSSATVARVSKWLFRGMNGYKIMISRIINAHHNNQLLKRMA
ncbi:MAG: YerC/YecD family TrpR-related protein [Patescibacteria group bacterium]